MSKGKCVKVSVPPSYKMLINAYEVGCNHIGYFNDGSGAVLINTRHGDSISFRPEDLDDLMEAIRYAQAKCLGILEGLIDV
jgi:hypothetical protein